MRIIAYRNVASISRGLYAYKPVLETGLYTRHTRQAYKTCTLPRQGLYALSAIPVQKALAGTVLCTSRAYARDTSRVLRLVHYSAIPVQKALSGTVSCTNRAYARDTSGALRVLRSCVLARLIIMHATGLCATGGCRIQASTRDRLVHKSGLCARHYGIEAFKL